MRRALIWLLMLLLPACASAQSLLPQLVAQKQAAQEAQAGMYAYTLTVRNLGESAVERIFVEESGAMGDTLFPEGAFTDFEGGDALLNQNGTATILRLDPGQTVTLRYEGALPEHFAQTAVQTECAISAMYRDAAGESYLLLALADQPVPLAESRPPQTVPTEEADAAGGILAIALEQEHHDGVTPGHTYENAVTLRNLGTGPLTGIILRAESLRIAGESVAEGVWLDAGGWTIGADGALEQPAGETLLPGESMVFRCCWTVPLEAEGGGEGAVSAWVESGVAPRQDVCAVFRLNAPETDWSLCLTLGIVLNAGDCAWIAGTLALCAAMILLFRPGRFRPGRRGLQSRGTGADAAAAA